MPGKKADRIVIDTNLWISMLISKDFSYIDKSLNSRRAILIFSQDLLDEFLEVVNRPKFLKYFSKNDINLTLKFIDKNAEFINVNSNVEICRDSKDNFLLSLAKDGDADFILTGDKDLLDLKEFNSTKTITIKEFSEKKHSG
jgi:putative PIN family toxin of toxin-antitoxin system